MNSILKKIFVFSILGLLVSTCLLPNLNGRKAVTKIESKCDMVSWKEEFNDIEHMMNTDEKKVTISLKKYNDMGDFVDEPIGSVSIERAYDIKDSLNDIWQSNIPISEKTRNSLNLLSGIEGLDLPLKNFIKSSNHQNEDENSKTAQISSNKEDAEVFNFISAWGAFCVGQPNVYLFIGNRSIEKFLITESPEGGGYNMSFFAEYGISGLMLPFIGWGYFGTAGLFGIQTLQNPMLGYPSAFFAFIVGTVFVGLSFKIGDPYLSLFELYLGLAGFPLAFPV